MEHNHLVLEKIQIACYTTLLDHGIRLNDTQFRVNEVATETDRLSLMITGWLVGNKFPERSEFVDIAYPDGWWQMLKEEHAPEWFCKRWPVKMKKIRHESARYRYQVCPHWKSPFESEKELHFNYMKEPIGGTQSS